MIRFDVPGMSCGHCTAAIERALKASDPSARVSCDLGTKTVEVDSILNPAALSEAIRGAGYDVKTRTATS